VRDLFQRAAHKPLTVLFGRSGLGKTSLLQAALVPRLREAGFVPIVLRLDYGEDASPLLAQFVHGSCCRVT
jgi:predicted GTPase